MAMEVFLAAGNDAHCNVLGFNTFSTPRLPLSATSPGSQGAAPPPPPKWMERPCTMALTVANRAHICSVVPHLHLPSGSSTSGFRLWQCLELLLS